MKVIATRTLISIDGLCLFWKTKIMKKKINTAIETMTPDYTLTCNKTVETSDKKMLQKGIR